MRWIVSATLTAMMVCAAAAACFASVPRAVSYQGKLVNGAGQLVDGARTFTFRLFGQPIGGTPYWTETRSVQVSGGLLAVSLGSVTPIPDSITGGDLYLEVEVDGTTLLPRQRIVSSAFAIRAGTVDDAAITSAKLADGSVTNVKVASVAWGKLTSIPAGFADGTDNDTTYAAGAGLNLSGNVFSLNPAYTNGLYWSLSGNSGTTPGTNFLGTTNNQAFEIKVNSTRALRLEPSAASPNVILGSSSNSVTSGVYGGTVGGGGTAAYPNLVTDDGGVVGGGRWNQAGDNAGATSDASYATVSGGDNNVASGLASTVSGGNDNLASGDYAAIGGGYGNKAGGSHATVPGGAGNTAQGSYSLTAGRRARASYDGCFVWSDSVDADFASTSTNQFLVRASGGVGIGANDPQALLDVNGPIRSRAGGFMFPDGTMQTTAATGLVLPYAGSISSADSAFSATNSGAGIAGSFEISNASNTSPAVLASTNGSGPGIKSAAGYAAELLGKVYVSGNLGVGTSSPTTPVDVNGVIRSSSGGFRFPDGTTQTTAFGLPYSGAASSANDVFSINNTSSSGGGAIKGETSSQAASAYAVLGRVNATSPGGFSAGVRGINAGTGSSGIGVFGSHSGGGWGVYGTTFSGAAVRGYASGSGNAIEGSIMGSGWAGAFDGGSSGNGVSITTVAGKTGLTVSGGTKNAVVATSSGDRLLYTEESTEVWFTDYGFGKLTDGRVTIKIDPLFAETVALDAPYHVFVQLRDPECEGVAVMNQSSSGFDVVELRHGKSDAAFSYRIVAKRKNYATARLEPAPETARALKR